MAIFGKGPKVSQEERYRVRLLLLQMAHALEQCASSLAGYPDGRWDRLAAKFSGFASELLEIAQEIGSEEKPR
jgi:hypothetical protein